VTEATDVLDLFVLDGGAGTHAVTVARCGHDLATARLDLTALATLVQFRDRIRHGVQAVTHRPSPDELYDYGTRLFDVLFGDGIDTIHARLSDHLVRIQLFSNHEGVQELPWEYLQEPGAAPGPRLTRSVIRIVPTVGHDPPRPAPPTSDRVLFATARPKGTEQVPWADVRDSIERAFRLRFPQALIPQVCEAADSDRLMAALRNGSFDIFHFNGHGEVRNQEAGLLLIDARTACRQFLPARELVGMLRGRGIRLVILSACDTASGFQGSYGNLAALLVREGVSAVVANQLPVPYDSVAPFVGAMYETLLRHGDIDRAVAEGRQQLWSCRQLATKASANLEWGIPVLYRHFANPRIFGP
jgi:hypothetical protein